MDLSVKFRSQQKFFFPPIFLAYSFLKVHLHHKKTKKSKNNRNKGFWHKIFLFDDGRIRIRKAQKLTDPTSVADPNLSYADPDPAFHFDADPDPTFHSDADPDPTFQFDADPDPTTHFFPDLDPPILQNDL
jgi:hypothetical protein